jgi:hypothetical protein
MARIGKNSEQSIGEIFMELLQLKLRILARRSEGISFDHAFRMAKERNERIISNKEVDKIAQEYSTEACGQFKEAYPVWTGTMAAYTKPNENFDSVIQCRDPDSGISWIFPVPFEYRNFKDAVLVAEHPNYELEIKHGKITVHAEKSKILLVENFPKKGGWYKFDEKTAIPISAPFSTDHGQHIGDRTKFLWRIQKRIGPIVRGRGLDAYAPPSTLLGVLTTSCERMYSQIRELTEKANKK